MRQINVIATIKVPGVHYWPCAPEELPFLKTPHRHLFWIRVSRSVEGLDREIEILSLQNDIMKALDQKFEKSPFGYKFYSLSCEQIGVSIIEGLSITNGSVEVLEDGENGAIILCQS